MIVFSRSCVPSVSCHFWMSFISSSFLHSVATLATFLGVFNDHLVYENTKQNSGCLWWVVGYWVQKELSGMAGILYIYISILAMLLGVSLCQNSLNYIVESWMFCNIYNIPQRICMCNHQRSELLFTLLTTNSREAVRHIWVMFGCKTCLGVRRVGSDVRMTNWSWCGQGFLSFIRRVLCPKNPLSRRQTKMVSYPR